MANVTFYLTSTNDTLVTTARQLTTTAPASTATVTSKLGKATGWGTLWSQGNTTNWDALASEPAFGDTHGFILNNTSMEGVMLAAGACSATVRVASSSGVTTGVWHVRVGKRDSSGVFTQYVDMTTASTTTTTSLVAKAVSGTAASSMTFNTGDKLYVQIGLQVTSNTSSSNTSTTSLGENSGANDSITIPEASIITKTQAATARIQVTSTKTQTATARIKNTTFSYGDAASLPTGTATLANVYTSTQVTNAQNTSNTTNITNASSNTYRLHQFFEKVASSPRDISCKVVIGQAASVANVLLQAYNISTSTWDTIATDNTTAAGGTTILTASNFDLTNYRDSDLFATFRVVQ